MRWSWTAFYTALFLYRCAFSVAGQLLIAPLTPLGDSPRYQDSTPEAFAARTYRSSDAMTDTIGAIFKTVSLGHPVVINLLFQSVAFAGIFTLLRKLDPASRRIMAALVLLPSFTLWSSVASKEAIATLAVCLVCTYVVDLYRSAGRVRLPHVLGAYLLLVYKPVYYPALTFLVGMSILARRVRQKALLVTCAGLASLVAVYVFRNRIDALAFEILGNQPWGRSNRLPFFVDQYDVLTKAVPGMVLTFVGPTWNEARSSLLHLASFAESILLIVTLAVLVGRRFLRLPVYSVALSFFTTVWLLFVSYPPAVLNPGSAIRYRTNYIVVIFLLAAFILSRRLYEDWIRRGAGATTLGED